ncbi:oligosaccharide flippase family protein [Geodermatophilus sp. SYSU D00696]
MSSTTLGRQTAWLSVGTLGGLFLGLLQTPILYRTLSSADFGLWALAYGLGTAVATLDFGLGAATTRFMTVAMAEGDARRARVAYGYSILFASVLIAAGGLVCLVFAPTLGSLVGSRYVGPSSPTSVVWATWALMSCYLLLTVGRFALVALLDFRFVGSWQLAGQLGVLVATTAVALGGGDAEGILWATAVVAVCQTAVYVSRAAVRRQYAEGRGGSRERLSLRAMLRFSAWMQLNGWNGFLNSQTDKLLITAVASTSSIAPFEAANTMARLVRVIPAQYLVALSPRMAAVTTEAASGDVTGQINRSLVHIIRLTLPPAALLLGLAPLFLQVWLGEVPEGAVVMLFALVIGHAVNVLTGPGTVYLRTIGEPGLEVAYGLVQTALNVGLSIWLGLLMGALGVVVATGISTVAASLLFLVLFHRGRSIHVSDDTKRLLGRMAVLAAAVCSICLAVASWVAAQRYPVVGQLAALGVTGVVGATLLVLSDLTYWRPLLASLRERGQVIGNRRWTEKG